VVIYLVYPSHTSTEAEADPLRHSGFIQGLLPEPTAYNKLVLQQLRNELAVLKAWDAAVFACEERTELDAIAHRIIRMAEILRKMREIVERN